MFYAPKTVASMVAGIDSFELYSDMHKDAIGCRPGPEQSRREREMSPVERGVEIARLGEWMREDERIQELRTEVARFDLSRAMEYLVRRGEAESPKEAFQMHVMGRMRCESIQDFLDTIAHYGWDYVCFNLNLPYSDAPKLQEFWEAQG